jgi:uncharacterized integral membrane protein (TIGR00698 family)
MSSAIAVARPVSEGFWKQGVRLIPGLLLLIAVGYAGKIIERSIATYGKAHHLTLPNIEYVLWAIVIGLLIANTVGVPKLFQAGIATYEFWLICGVSAIIATKGAIDADDEDASYAIAAILSLGAVSLFVFPLVGHWLHLSDQSYGLWAGLGVDNTAEAVAAGALYSDAAGKVAVLAKTARNAMIGFVVLGYAIHWARKEKNEEVSNKAAFLWQKFPKFVLGFLLISGIATAHAFSKDQLVSLANLSRWAFLLTFAGVGLRTNIGELGKQGWRPFFVGAIGEVVIAFLTLGLVFGADSLLR